MTVGEIRAVRVLVPHYLDPERMLLGALRGAMLRDLPGFAIERLFIRIGVDPLGTPYGATLGEEVLAHRAGLIPITPVDPSLVQEHYPYLQTPRSGRPGVATPVVRSNGTLASPDLLPEGFLELSSTPVPVTEIPEGHVLECYGVVTIGTPGEHAKFQTLYAPRVNPVVFFEATGETPLEAPVVDSCNALIEGPQVGLLASSVTTDFVTLGGRVLRRVPGPVVSVLDFEYLEGSQEAINTSLRLLLKEITDFIDSCSLP